MLRAELIRQELIKRELAKRNFTSFMQYMHPDISLDRFHKAYYEILDKFAHGHVRKLIVTCPPQSGKSEGSTRNLPAYLHGINNNLRICIASYGFPLAEGFNRAIKANIASTKYSNIFPDTILSKTEQAKKYKGAYDPAIYVNNARTYRLINKEGSLIAVGRGGALTGNPVDIGIVDDLYKDDTEGNSL